MSSSNVFVVPISTKSPIIVFNLSKLREKGYDKIEIPEGIAGYLEGVSMPPLNLSAGVHNIPDEAANLVAYLTETFEIIIMLTDIRGNKKMAKLAIRLRDPSLISRWWLMNDETREQEQTRIYTILEQLSIPEISGKEEVDTHVIADALRGLGVQMESMKWVEGTGQIDDEAMARILSAAERLQLKLEQETVATPEASRSELEEEEMEVPSPPPKVAPPAESSEALPPPPPPRQQEVAKEVLPRTEEKPAMMSRSRSTKAGLPPPAPAPEIPTLRKKKAPLPDVKKALEEEIIAYEEAIAESEEMEFDEMADIVGAVPPEEAKPEAKTIHRHVEVTYYSRMRMMRTYPLRTRVSVSRLEEPAKRPHFVERVEDIVEFEPDTELVEMKLVMPGCLINPSSIIVDVREELTDNLFYITPLSTGSFTGLLEIWKEGRRATTIELPFRITSLTPAKISALSGAITSSPLVLTPFGINLEEKINTTIENGSSVIKSILSSLGYAKGLSIALTALFGVGAVLYAFLTREKEAYRDAFMR